MSDNNFNLSEREGKNMRRRNRKIFIGGGRWWSHEWRLVNGIAWMPDS